MPEADHWVLTVDSTDAHRQIRFFARRRDTLAASPCCSLPCRGTTVTTSTVPRVAFEPRVGAITPMEDEHLIWLDVHDDVGMRNRWIEMLDLDPNALATFDEEPASVEDTTTAEADPT
ncbi:MAG: hypothetical protein D6705_10500 [Deltaproteobacteria bacterium]|nr:MAG: hypothetical protein D6705_10500 [Deltaproteobacteria bacterium]